MGEAPVAIYKDFAWGGTGSFRLYVGDDKGRGIMPGFTEDAFPHPPFPEEDFVTLAPGDAIEQERTVALSGYELAAGGEYTLAVSYTGISEEFAPESLRARFWQGGTLRSKSVKFKVAK